MKDLIKEVALEGAEKFGVVADDSEIVDLVTWCVAELSKRAEAVGFCHIDAEEGADCFQAWADTYVNIPVFTFQPIHDIEAIENRTAEACAKVCDSYQGGEYYATLIGAGEWRKYK